MKKSIGLVAGNGRLPLLLAANLRKKGNRVVAIGHVGETRRDIQHRADILHWVHIGELGKIIQFLKSEGVEKVLFAGGIPKTHFFSNARPDERAIKVLLRLKDKKDDPILRAVADEIESE